MSKSREGGQQQNKSWDLQCSHLGISFGLRASILPEFCVIGFQLPTLRCLETSFSLRPSVHLEKQESWVFMCVWGFPSLDLGFLSQVSDLVSQVSNLLYVPTLRPIVSHSGSLDFYLTQNLNFPCNSVRSSIQQEPSFYIITVRALMVSSLRIPSILNRFFHVCLQVSSLKPSVFYFGPSTVLDHLTGCPGIRNSSVILILIAGTLYLLGRGQETPLSQTHTNDHIDAQNMQRERTA